jgi:hypothetical protein
MKLYFVTGIGKDTKESHRFIVGQIGRAYSVCQITSSIHYGIYNSKMYGIQRSMPHYYVSSRALHMREGVSIEQDMAEHMYLDNMFTTPIPADRVRWLKDNAHSMYKGLIYALYMSTSSSKANAIYRRIVGMYDAKDDKYNNKYIQWHSNHVYANNFVLTRDTYKKLGELVATAIKDGDSCPVDEFLMEECDGAGINQSALVSTLDDVLDLGVMECDCGHIEYKIETHAIGRGGRDTWCEACFTESAVYVENRDEYWHIDDAYQHSNGDYYSYEEEEEDCEEDDDPDNLMAYSTNVLNHVEKDNSIQSSPHGDFLLGVEFEMETGDECSVGDAVDDVRQQLGTSYCVCKSDGSLGHKGLEIVTAPRGLAEHIKRFKEWEVKSHYRAWDTKRCGLHVHIDSRAFTQMTLGKFVMLINSETNVDFIRKIAGRHPNTDDQARSYCSSEYQPSLVNPKSAIKGKSSERYRMVNLQNLGRSESKRLTDSDYYSGRYNTVELRIFRASLKKDRLLAQIEFTHACVSFCRVASWRDLNQVSFVKWLKTVSSIYPNLADWYGVRRRNAKVTAESQCHDKVETV